VLHEIPIFHRDIQWPNIIQNADNPHNWILIDWEYAAIPPTEGQPRFNMSDHSPRILEDNHGAEVDIWGVGHLIISSTAADLSSDLEALGKRVCNEAHILTAREVLELVNLLPLSGQI
jgi:thiamine kinase-like enzyme